VLRFGKLLQQRVDPASDGGGGTWMGSLGLSTTFFFCFLFDLSWRAFEPPRERLIDRDVLIEAVVMPASVNLFLLPQKKVL
jgi:hypothetical protein